MTTSKEISKAIEASNNLATNVIYIKKEFEWNDCIWGNELTNYVFNDDRD